MKYPLLKSLLSLGTIVLACSCSDDKPSSSSDDGVPEQQSTITSCDNAWLLSGDRIYLGYSDLTVTDEAGVQIGFITAIPNSSNVNIVDLSGNLLISNVNLLATTVIFGDNVRFKTIDNVFHLKPEMLKKHWEIFAREYYGTTDSAVLENKQKELYLYIALKQLYIIGKIHNGVGAPPDAIVAMTRRLLG